MADEQNEFLPGFAARPAGGHGRIARGCRGISRPPLPSRRWPGRRPLTRCREGHPREEAAGNRRRVHQGRGGGERGGAEETACGPICRTCGRRTKSAASRTRWPACSCRTPRLEVPESVLQEETRQQVYEMVRQSQTSGGQQGRYREPQGRVFDTATRTASEKMKLRYILRRIAREEEFTLEDEVEARIAMLARSWGVPPEKLKADLEKRNALGPGAGRCRSEQDAGLAARSGAAVRQGVKEGPS